MSKAFVPFFVPEAVVPFRIRRMELVNDGEQGTGRAFPVPDEDYTWSVSS